MNGRALFAFEVHLVLSFSGFTDFQYSSRLVRRADNSLTTDDRRERAVPPERN
jgi:hypothetical protein